MSVHDLRQLSAGVDLLVAEVMAERPLEEAVRNRRMSANLLSRTGMSWKNGGNFGGISGDTTFKKPPKLDVMSLCFFGITAQYFTA